MKSFVLLSLLFLLLPSSVLHAAIISMGSVEAEAGDTVIIPVTVDVPGDVAAAVFTISYDSTALNLTNVESTFFDTFSNQWDLLIPRPDPLPPSTIEINGEVYEQPMLYDNKVDKMLLAGVRVQTGATQTILFNLTFTVHSESDSGVYPITLSPTILTSTAMGYDGAGEEVPPLVGLVEGESNLALAYPALPTIFEDGAITVNPSITDTDQDLIDDNWEEIYFPGDLTILAADNDYDSDGYSDLQEYLNSLTGLDEHGMEWDPTAPNEPDQNGYVVPGKSSFWILMMPAIQAGAIQSP